MQSAARMFLVGQEVVFAERIFLHGEFVSWYKIALQNLSPDETGRVMRMSLRGRIAKLERVLAERKLAERKKKDDLVNCVCGKVVVAFPNQVDKLRAELEGTCPVHGVLHVSQIVRVTYTGSGCRTCSPDEGEPGNGNESGVARSLVWRVRMDRTGSAPNETAGFEDHQVGSDPF